MSLHIAKRFIRPLVLASAAIFFHISVASAADSAGDVQQQMRELLTGTTTAHLTSQSGPPSHSVGKAVTSLASPS